VASGWARASCAARNSGWQEVALALGLALLQDVLRGGQLNTEPYPASCDWEAGLAGVSYLVAPAFTLSTPAPTSRPPNSTSFHAAKLHYSPAFFASLEPWQRSHIVIKDSTVIYSDLSCVDIGFEYLYCEVAKL